MHGAHEGEGEGEGEGEDNAALEEEMEVLEARRARLMALLCKVDSELEARSCPRPPHPTNRHTHILTGIRMQNKLSFRGIQKAQEMFERLSQQALMGFDAFRAMRGLGNILPPRERRIASREEWQAYLDEEDIKLTGKQVNLHEFLRYKIKHELEEPITPQLEALGLGVLPQVQQFWKKIHAVVHEMSRYVKVDGTKFLPDAQTLPVDQLPLLFHCLGIHIETKELYWQLRHLLWHRKVIKNLDEKAFRIHFYEAPSRFQELLTEQKQEKLHRTAGASIPDDIQKLSIIPFKTFIGWLFSGKEFGCCPTLYAQALSAKYSLHRIIRATLHFSYAVEDILQHLGVRGVLRNSEIPKEDKNPESVNCDFTCILGEGISDEEGSSLNFRMTKIQNVPQTLKLLKLPKDAGMTVVIDLLIREHASELVISRCIHKLREFLELHFYDELCQYRSFKGIFVSQTVNREDDAPVVRVCFVWKKEASIDSMFQRAGLNLCLTDVVSSFTGDFRCSVNIVDLVEDVRLVLQHSLTLKMTTCFTVRKKVAIFILERIIHAMDSGPSRTIVEAQVANAQETRSQRPASINPFLRQSSSRGKVLRAAQEEELLKHFSTHTNALRGICCSCLHFVKNLKTGMVNVNLGSPSDFATAIRRLSSSFNKYFPAKSTLEEGHVAKLFKHWVKITKRELQEIQSKVLNHESTALAKLLKQEREDLDNEEYRKRKELKEQEDRILEQLKRLNIDAGPKGTHLANEPETIDRVVESKTATQMKGDRLGMETLEACKEACTGLHSVFVITGSTSITLQFNGFDIFDIFPRLQRRMAADETEA